MIKEFVDGYFHNYALWLTIVYSGVLTAMVIDLITGIRKSRRLGRKTTSRGYKQTCDKAMKYFMPMICLTCIDLIASAILPFPIMTMAMGIYNIFCELKSIMESTAEKAEIDRCVYAAHQLLQNYEPMKKLIDEIFELNAKKEKQHTKKEDKDEKN